MRYGNYHDDYLRSRKFWERRRSGIVVPSSSLLTNLKAYWKLDETSGTRLDSHGNYDLTDNGSVGSVIGKLGNAASFVSASSQSLSQSPMLGVNAWTVSLWLRVTGTPSIRGAVFGDFDDSNHTRHYCAVNSSRNLFLDEYLPSGGSATSTTALALDTWYHVVVVQTSPASRKLYIDGNEEATSSEVYTGGLPTAFRVGGRGGSSGSIVDYLDGDIDELSLYYRALTMDEILAHSNSGAGLTYPFT